MLALMRRHHKALMSAVVAGAFGVSTTHNIIGAIKAPHHISIDPHLMAACRCYVKVFNSAVDSHL
jgi:hypothetical protein